MSARPILPVEQPLDLATADATNGAVKDVSRFTNVKIQFGGTFGGGTVFQPQGSVDGTNFFSIGSTITAATATQATLVAVDDAVRLLRIRTTTADSHTATAKIGGFEQIWE